MILDQKQILYLVGAVLVIVFLILVVVFGFKGGLPKTVELEFWSIYDDSDVYKDFIKAFNKQHSYIKIKYSKKSYDTYEKDLIDALAAGKGPDIFSIQNTWLPKHQNKLVPLPQDLMSLKDYQSTFVDVAVVDFIAENRIYAIPFFVDTLALYYNKDYFNDAGIAEPPKIWEDFLNDVALLTIRDTTGKIVRAGAAIGTAKNINRSTDILSLLMLQNGAEMVNAQKTRASFNSKAGEDALKFYTNFANSQKAFYTWNSQLDYSIDMFYAGRAAMMFNYAYHVKTIKAKSPHLNFAVAPMPQLSSRTKDINYANYWAQAVSKKSKNAKYAWQFVLWMSQNDNLKKYAEITREPVSRRDLISWQKTDPEIGVFADQTLTAQSWYQIDSSAIETIFADMIELVVGGQAAADQAIKTAASQVTLLMSK